MGKVFRAKDRLTGQIVALKRISDRFSIASPASSRTPSLDSRTTEPAHNATQTMALSGTQADRVARNWRAAHAALASEFRVLCSLRHPNIISVLDYGFAGRGGPFYTMTLLDGAESLTAAAWGQPEQVKLGYLFSLL